MSGIGKHISTVVISKYCRSKLCKYLVQKVVHPLSHRAKRLRDRTSLSLGGNTGGWAKSSYVKLWRHIGSRRIQVMKKLDESKVKWIILQKRNGETTSSIAKTMNVSTRWVKKLWARYRYTDPDRIIYPAPREGPRMAFQDAGSILQC